MNLAVKVATFRNTKNAQITQSEQEEDKVPNSSDLHFNEGTALRCDSAQPDVGWKLPVH